MNRVVCMLHKLTVLYVKRIQNSIKKSHHFLHTLHNEELHNLHSSPDISGMTRSWRMRWLGNVARIAEVHTKLLWEKCEGRMPLGRPRTRWKNIKSGYVRLEDVCWLHLALDKNRWRAFFKQVIGGNFLCKCKTVSFSRRVPWHQLADLLIVDRGVSVYEVHTDIQKELSSIAGRETD
jgi:hypothetical protein